MKLTTEQKNAVEWDGHVCLVSCPGSGKTRTIVSRVLRDLKHVRETSRKVVCITYTHAAVDEIEHRLQQLGVTGDDAYYDVTTIHSFCLNEIIRPYHHLLPHLATNWAIVTHEDIWFRDTVEELIEKHKISHWAADRFENIQRQYPTEMFVPNGIPEIAAREFCERADNNGKLTLNDIVFFSACLIAENRYIARGLGSRYSSIIIDEFQDTSTDQVEILTRIYSENRSTFFFVGDPNQSILGFAGASPELMQTFATSISAAKHLSLSGNFRCSHKIVTFAERLCPTNPPMKAVGETKGCLVEPKYLHCATSIEGIFDHFLTAIDEMGISHSDSAVLAPWWIPLLHLGRELRTRGIPIVGPGSRPYQRKHEFADLAEHLCAYHLERDQESALSLHRALFHTILNVTGYPAWTVYSYHGKCVLFKLVHAAASIRRKHENAILWLREAASDCSQILVAEQLIPMSRGHVLLQSAEAMIGDMVKRKVDTNNLSVDDLGLFGNARHSLHLMTMHRAKGREYDAVAVIDVHDNKVPHFSVTTSEEINEARRLMYVATTRARKLLMFFTDDADYRNTPSRFLGSQGLGFV